MESILDYYVNLLVIQYGNKEKLKSTVRTVVEEFVVDNVPYDLRDAFSIDTAVGAQLDILGKYIGINRFYQGQNLRPSAFGFVTYVNTTASTQKGFSNYSDFETKSGYVLAYKDVLSGSLSLGDDDYRVLLKLKILQNSNDHSHKSIDDGLFGFFGSAIRADSVGNMIMDYFVPNDLTAIMSTAIQKQVLPKPMGVGIRYVILEKGKSFGFATYETTPPNATGFSDYTDVDSKAGGVLTYNKILEA